MAEGKEAALIVAAMQMAVRVHEATTPAPSSVTTDEVRSALFEEFRECFNGLAALLTPENAAKPSHVIRSGKHDLYGSRDK